MCVVKALVCLANQTGEKMIELPFPPSGLNPNKRLHWHVKGRIARNYRRECFIIARSHPPLQKFKITFHPPDKRLRDRDNLISAFKAGQDGLSDAWKINDAFFQITYEPIGTPVKGGKTLIEPME